MTILTRFRHYRAIRKLAASMKPDPQYIYRRIAHVPPERRARTKFNHWDMQRELNADVRARRGYENIL
jgi:hypothetical protein